MQVENHKEEVPFSHYQQLFAQADPSEIAARLPGTQWDGENFTVTLLGRTYQVHWPDAAFTVADSKPLPPLPTLTFLLRYLLEGKELPALGQWKTFREMPWGELYIKPYTGRVLTRAAFTFGTRLEAFRKAAQAMGAENAGRGDAGYVFTVLGDYKMQLLVWAGDEEFPPNAQVLYSDNFSDGFAPEDRVVAGDILISTVKSFM